MVFYFSQSWAIKLCYKPYTKGGNKDICPLNIKTHWNNLESFLKCLTQIYKKRLTKKFQLQQLSVSTIFLDWSRLEIAIRKLSALICEFLFDRFFYFKPK